jgi:epoxyqueuosine reductase QueG
MTQVDSVEEETRCLLELAKKSGALAGIADLSLLEGLPTYGGLRISDYRYAVSVAMALPSDAVKMITEDSPGVLYGHAYKTSNQALDALSLAIAQEIEGRGYRTLIIPASLTIDREKNVGHASHKAFAWAAGLGWIGRNALLINPAYGPAVRLATVLTDMPLKPNSPVTNGCGECRLCVLSCPAKALTHVKFDVRPSSRDEILDAGGCLARLEKNKESLAQDPLTFQYAATICGICIKVCPIAKQRRVIRR